MHVMCAKAEHKESISNSMCLSTVAIHNKKLHSQTLSMCNLQYTTPVYNAYVMNTGGFEDPL